SDGSGLPRFVVNEFRKFLRCGVLAHRFALYGERLYRLIYRIGGDAVFVLALFDGRRELEDVLLDRLVRSPEAPRALAPLESELHPARRDLVCRRPFPPGRMLSLHVPERLQALLQVVAGTDARDAGADDQDVQVFRRDVSPLPRNTPPLAAGVPAAWRSRRGFC